MLLLRIAAEFTLEELWSLALTDPINYIFHGHCATSTMKKLVPYSLSLKRCDMVWVESRGAGQCGVLQS